MIKRNVQDAVQQLQDSREQAEDISRARSREVVEFNTDSEGEFELSDGEFPTKFRSSDGDFTSPGSATDCIIVPEGEGVRTRAASGIHVPKKRRI